MQKPLIIAVSGLHRGENPQPGPAVIHSIRRCHPSSLIVGLSYDPMESGLFCSGHDGVEAAFSMPFPVAGSKALLDRLDDIRQAYPLDMIIPCLDTEFPNYIAVAVELQARKINVALPDDKTFRRRSKDKLGQLGKEAGVIVPRTVVASDLDATYAACERLGYPLYLKSRFYEVRLVSKPVEVAGAFRYLAAAYGVPVIAQAYIHGKEEYAVTGLGDGKGGVVGCCAIRKLMKTSAGKTFSGIVVADPALHKHATQIAKVLKWYGPFELEFIKGQRGYELIEVNPRFPAWIDFPSQIGCNLPAALVAMLAAYKLPPIAPCPAGRMFVRHCVDLAGDISQLADMSVTGTKTSGTTKLRQLMAAK
jgi:carbamoyl-phosphate synthase large subunit